jgi:hypothetical protein
MIRTIARTQVLKSVPVSRLVLPSLTVSHSYATKAQNLDFKKRNSDMPYEVYREVIETTPMPMREEFMGTKKLSSEQLEKINFEPGKHHIPQTAGDKMAYYMVKALRTLPDTYFGKDHYMRAVMLETIAAVPGM